MRTRILTALVAALALAGAAPARARDKDKVEPTTPFSAAVVARLAPLDDLIADLRYVVKRAGREEEAKQIEGMLKARTGPKGLEGVDTKKPIGMYVLVDKQLNQSQLVFLLPIADRKTFLTFLETLDLKPEEKKDGSYELTVENVPTGPILMRFAHGYLYAMPRLNEKQALPAEAKLPKPATALAGSGMLSLAVNVEEVPRQVRKVAVSALALQLGNLKEQAPEGQTEKQAAVREAILDEMTAQVKSLLEEGQSFNLKLAVDRKKHDLTLEAKLSGRKGTALAKSLASLGQAEGIGAALMAKDQVLGGFARLALPARVVKAMGPALDESTGQGLKGLTEEQRKLAEPLVKALDRTLKSGTLDAAVQLRGPGAGGKYTFLAAARVEGGDKIEKAIKQALTDAPDNVKKVVKVDAAKGGGVNIHQVTQKADANTKAVLGDGPLYFALRKDAAMATMGEGALAGLKGALAAKPKAGQLAHFEVSMAALAPLIKDRKGAPEAAKKAFKEKGDDRVTLNVTSGPALAVKLSIKSAVLTFAGLLDKADRDAEEKKD